MTARTSKRSSRSSQSMMACESAVGPGWSTRMPTRILVAAMITLQGRGSVNVACLLRALPRTRATNRVDDVMPDAQPAYPDAPRLDLVEDIHGTPVADPYRWLESSDDPRTVEWLAAQSAL
ncbi:MAG: hypothetical protein ACYC2Z_08235, partial [Candidatus Nanopelagicales bacterium]